MSTLQQWNSTPVVKGSCIALRNSPSLKLREEWEKTYSGDGERCAEVPSTHQPKTPRRGTGESHSVRHIWFRQYPVSTSGKLRCPHSLFNKTCAWLRSEEEQLNAHTLSGAQGRKGQRRHDNHTQTQRSHSFDCWVPLNMNMFFNGSGRL